MQVRHRRLEWIATGCRDDFLIQAGNASAHQGAAIADAELYQPSCEYGSRNDKETFGKLYGVFPEFVWKYQNCEDLIKVLDWRAGVYDFCHCKHKSKGRWCFRSSTFMKLLGSMLVNVEKSNGSPTESICQFFLGLQNELEKLEKEYLKMLDAHSEYLRTR